MENQPLNTVFISSRHYADLVESETFLNAIRDYLFGHLTAKLYGYDNHLEVVFDGNPVELLKVFFPENYAQKADKLIQKYKSDNPDKDISRIDA